MVSKVFGGAVTKIISILDDATARRYRFEIFANDKYIRPMLERGYNFDSALVVALASLAKPADVMIDIGAHIGTVCIPMSTLVAQVHAFEPQKAIARLLHRNIANNDRKNITVYEQAVGSETGDIFLSSTIADDTGNHNLSSNQVNYGGIQLGTSGESVKIATLDSFELPCQILKVDVEGAEPYVFYGAQATIRRYKPVICFERNYQKLPAGVIDNREAAAFDIVAFAAELGYKAIIRVGIANYILTPADPPGDLKLHKKDLGFSIPSYQMIINWQSPIYRVKIGLPIFRLFITDTLPINRTSACARSTRACT